MRFWPKKPGEADGKAPTQEGINQPPAQSGAGEVVLPDEENRGAESAPGVQDVPGPAQKAETVNETPAQGDAPAPAAEAQDAAAAESNAAPEGQSTQDAAALAAAKEERAWRRTRRLRALRRAAPTVLVCAVYLVLAFFMFKNAAEVEPGAALLSLRYDAPLTGEQVAYAKFALEDPEEEHPFTATFWYESPMESITTSRATVATPALFVDGDMATARRVTFLHGGYPGVLEKRGVALSRGLAWELFGSVDVVGTEFDWNGTTYTVRGVFEGDALMLLAQVDAKEAPVPGFTGVELGGHTEEDPRTTATALAQTLRLGTPSAMVSATSVPMLISAMAWVPAILLCLWFLVRLLGLLRHTSYWAKQVVWLVLLLAAAILIPRALGQLPGWMIPTKWSDLTHWSELFKELNTRLTEWLAMKPNLEDVQLRKTLLLQLVLMVPSVFAMVGVIRRWAEHFRRKDMALRLAEAHNLGDKQVAATLDEALDAARKKREKRTAAQEEHDDIEILTMEKKQKKPPV